MQPKVINYRDYKEFVNGNFLTDLCDKISKETFQGHENDLENFLSICIQATNRHAPSKKKFIRGNQSPFMNKDLSKAIMTRSRLRNKFLKSRTLSNRENYAKQRNFCVTLLRKTKKDFYSNLKIDDICDNKLFWKTIKPFLSDKIQNSDQILLIENENVIENNNEICEIMNDFFSNIVTNLNIPIFNVPNDNNSLDSKAVDPILKILHDYKNHPSIKVINKKRSLDETTFSFTPIERDELISEIKNLDEKKASQESDIPTKIIKGNYEFFSDFLLSPLNKCLTSGKFPNALKLADVTPIYKKGKKSNKENYRPISILPNI